MVEEAYTGEDLFFSLFGATGLEGRNRDYAGAGGDPLQIAYSAYTFDPQGNLVQPVTLHPERSVGFMVRVDTSSAYDGFGWSSTVGAEGQIDPYSPVGFGGQQGYYRDYTGLYLLTHRYYDAGAGRFVTRDPIGYRGGINLYGFAGNNPVNESDPSGFAPADHLNGKAVERIDPSRLWMKPNRRDTAPIAEDGRGLEIHHIGQNPNGPFREMTMTDHRGPGNKGRNHPPGPPGIDHGNDWKASTRQYWEREWDSGRFDTLPNQPGPTPRKGWGPRALAEGSIAGDEALLRAGKGLTRFGLAGDVLGGLILLGYYYKHPAQLRQDFTLDTVLFAPAHRTRR